MDSLSKIVKPAIDENIRQFHTEANKLKSSFAASGRLKSGLYIVNITEVVQGFIAKCSKDIEEMCIAFNLGEKPLNHYVDEEFKPIVFELFEIHAKAGIQNIPSFERAMKQKKETLSLSLENMVKSIRQKMRANKPKWYSRIGLIVSAIIGAVVFFAALIEILSYFGITKEDILKIFQYIH